MKTTRTRIGLGMALLMASLIVATWAGGQREAQAQDADPQAALSGLELGGYLFNRLNCSLCHGENGIGGVTNPNYINDAAPSLFDYADRVGIWEQEHADLVVGMLLAGEPLEPLLAAAPWRGAARTISQIIDTRALMVNGSPAGKLDETGIEPRSMPNWGAQLNASEIDALLSYVIMMYEFEE